MEAKKYESIVQLFDGCDTRLIIPLYQRNYDWKPQNCERLFEDIVKVRNGEIERLFLGCIVRKGTGNSQYQIIDGQQRITTVALLLMALLDAAKNGDIVINNEKNANKVYQNYLIDPNDDGDNKVRLKPIKKDMEAYTALLEKKAPIEPSRVTDNYRLMRRLVATAGLSFEDYYDTIKGKLNIVCITLEADDDAQLIFESINSTGLALTEADKVRNYLLMDMDAATQERCYANYWSKIEEYTEDDTTILLRHYLTIKTRRKINDNKIYEEFKAFRERTHSDKEMLLRDILRHANKFSEIRHQENATSPFQRKLRELNELDSTTHMPFLIAFLLFADKNRFSDKDKTEVLNIVESYWARRIRSCFEFIQGVCLRTLFRAM